ncbi:hypothetical protein VTK56DRAFT_8037 [Thermocarpiscus australiensis]
MKCVRATNTLIRSHAVAGETLLWTFVQNLRPPEGRPRPCAYAINNTRHAPWPPPISRTFHHTTVPRRRAATNDNNDSNATGKNNLKTQAANGGNAAPSEPERPQPNPETPYDFTDLIYAFDRAEKRFTEELKKLRTGGRFNADVIGAIPVQVDRKSPQTFPLRELATVAPVGGRRWSILAFEEGSVKAIMSAVQRSDHFNQQPQRSGDNPLELTMTVEPERADALARRAREVCQAWRSRVRDEAHRRAEAHKKWRAERVILSDDLHKLREKLQKLQDERMKVIAAKEKEVVQNIMAKAG